MPPLDYFASLDPVVLKAPAACATSAVAYKSIEDLSGTGLLVLSMFNTAGTTPTCDAVLQATIDIVGVNAFTQTGTGTGRITDVEPGPAAVHETFTLHLQEDPTTFSVVGTVSGTLTAGVVGTKYVCDQVSFTVIAGGVAFVHTDAITFHIIQDQHYDTIKTFDQVTDTKVTEHLAINFDELGKYIRLSYTVDGTDSPAYDIGAQIFAFKR
jgi:hypothetical protein